MFNKKTEAEIELLKSTLEDQEIRLNNLEEDYSDFLEWKKMRDANAEAAAKQGHFYISADDTALLERFIQEINRDPDLAVLMTTAGGTTVSLRTHPHPNNNDKSFLNLIGKYEEEE
jgi:hypothetical protein